MLFCNCTHKSVDCKAFCREVVLVLGMNVAVFPHGSVKVCANLRKRNRGLHKLGKREIKERAVVCLEENFSAVFDDVFVFFEE